MRIRTIDGGEVTPTIGMVCDFVGISGKKWPEYSPVIIYEISDRDGGTIRYTDHKDGKNDWAAPCHFVVHSIQCGCGDVFACGSKEFESVQNNGECSNCAMVR